MSVKVAVINFSGNVGKTTVARHLVAPRIPGAEMISVESINADDGQGEAIRGKQFGDLQEYLLTLGSGSAVVDVGASNVEDFLVLMNRYRGSHEDFDFYVVPTVPARKQQQDTIATLIELARLGVPAEKIKLVFNMVEDGADVKEAFHLVFEFLKEHPLASADPEAMMGMNEIYQKAKATGVVDLVGLAADKTDYKAAMGKASDQAELLQLSGKLITRRLAQGVVPDLDTCFERLGILSAVPA